MTKFQKGYIPIWDLPIEQRIKQCQKFEVLGHKVEFTWKEAKEYYSNIYDCEVWINDIYEVHIQRGKKADWMIHEPSMKGLMDYVTIKRKDKKWIHDWRHFQLIKNELCGKEKEAIEIYPAESRLVDTANQYHLFVFPDRIPFGYLTRGVIKEEHKGGQGKAGQRAIL